MIPTTSPSPADAADARPLVWIKKLVLLKSIDPWDEIRKIDFTTGLNIIQGESNEADEHFQSGHGIGKTTVCRLIRYCLSEKTFGQKHVVDEVSHCFSDGYVGAEFELAGSPWSVLLPLGKRTKRFGMEGVALGGLVQAEGSKHYDAFTTKLSEVVLANVPVSESLTGGQTLLWLHVLAMCSRDQESRYDRHWNWREKRSESGTPVFGKPKVDAGLCLRAVLSLLDPNEPRLRTRLEQLDSAAKQLHEDIRRERELPTTLVTGLRRRLETEFAVHDAATAPLDASLLGLAAAVNNRQAALVDQIAQIEDRLVPLNRRISMTAASLLEPEELTEQIETASEATAEGTDTLLNQLNELQRVRQLLRDAETALCRYGQVLIGECSYVRSRTQQMDDEIRQRQLTVIPTISEREQAAARLAEQAQRQRTLVGQIQQRLDDMGRERDDLIEQRRNRRNQHERISALLSEIEDWNEIWEGRKPNTELQRLEQESSNNVSEVAVSK
jgi:chromosome segregation ATPase